MLSSVLNSKRAIQVNIAIIRTFVALRRIAITYREFERKLDEMEKKYDGQCEIVFQALKQLIDPPIKKKPNRQIGFHLRN